MTKGELRRARKLAREKGETLKGRLSINGPAIEFSESPRGYEARHRWAKHYDSLNGAPENDGDR